MVGFFTESTVKQRVPVRFGPHYFSDDQIKTDSLEISEVNCSATEQVNDAIFISGNNTVSQASASNIVSAKGVGFIKSKQGATKCTIVYGGLLSGFAGLIANKQYFLDITAGQITGTPPTGPGQVVVKVGIGWNSTTLMIDVDKDYTIRS